MRLVGATQAYRECVGRLDEFADRFGRCSTHVLIVDAHDVVAQLQIDVPEAFVSFNSKKKSKFTLSYEQTYNKERVEKKTVSIGTKCVHRFDFVWCTGCIEKTINENSSLYIDLNI